MADPTEPRELPSGDGEGPGGSDGRIIQADLRNEMSRSYLARDERDRGRALPRDGLKLAPADLYAMYELGCW